MEYKSCSSGRMIAFVVMLISLSFVVTAGVDTDTNSLGMKMIRIDAGQLTMGSDRSRDYWDEAPLHTVMISEPFFISETEVTVDQYRQFKPEFKTDKRFDPFVSGISWYDAMEFCNWLSQKEGKPYRLPTEAEWEYACRAGTTTLYWAGEKPPVQGKANSWGLKNMHDGVREWCYDWYAEYSSQAQINPVGPEYGMARVVRGGCLDDETAREDREIFNASCSRASIAPSFGLSGLTEKQNQNPSDKTGANAWGGEYRKGLIGTWFGGANLTNPKERTVITKIETKQIIDRDRGQNWSARWRGFIEAPYSGEITFEMKVSSGGILQIDNHEAINLWNREGVGVGKLQMSQGKKYPIMLSYNRDRGEPELEIFWSWAGQDKQSIPGMALSYSQNDFQVVDSESGNNDAFPGRHWIGFRVVQAPLPTTKPTSCRRSYATQGVRQNREIVSVGPDHTKSYFRKRYLLPTPLDNSSNKEIDAVGMHPAFRHHNHSPALEVCPNGDVLLVIYTSYNEYEPGVSLIASRLRFGADEWDMPERLFDFAAANDHAPMLWTEKDTLYFFWGSPKLDGGFPFQWTLSKDSGATWDEVKFPEFTGRIGPHSRQPINTALRDRLGVMYIASDGEGGRSVLWASGDNGRSWYDTEGRSAGRHTTYALLQDGKTILGMGGKNTDIEGYMPKAISGDGGKSWSVSKTPFPAQGANQRPSILRLRSGRLFFAGDFQHINGSKPAGIQQSGSYVALSDDDGQTWTLKTLVGAQPHENSDNHKGQATIGYSAARQAPNGMIHLIATMNRPCLHFEFNEAWILSKMETEDSASDEKLMASSGTAIEGVRQYQEAYPGGQVKIVFSGGIGNDGRFLLQGPETWFYSNGDKQHEANYHLGKKAGKETYWSQDGKVQWEWMHQDDGTSIWTHYWPNGKMKARSSWRNFKCYGEAERWDSDGKSISRVTFVDGRMQ